MGALSNTDLPVTWTPQQILPEACLLLLPQRSLPTHPLTLTCIGTRLRAGGHLLRIPVDEVETQGLMGELSQHGLPVPGSAKIRHIYAPGTEV